MAIKITNLTTTAITDVYTSINENAVTILSICNYSTLPVNVDIHVVPTGTVIVGNEHLFINQIEILANDTFVAYQGNEKFVLDNGDSIKVTCTAANSVNSIISHTEL